MSAHAPMPAHNSVVYCPDATCERSVRPRLETRRWNPGQHREPCDDECRRNAAAQAHDRVEARRA